MTRSPDYWIAQLVVHRASCGSPASYGREGHDAHRRGPGIGTAVATGAVGVTGGLAAAEVVDEIEDLLG